MIHPSVQNPCKDVPSIVRIVLPQAAKLHSKGAIDTRTYEAQIERITREELRPRGFALVVRELPEGGTRFVIRADSTGEVCETIDSLPI